MLDEFYSNYRTLYFRSLLSTKAWVDILHVTIFKNIAENTIVSHLSEIMVSTATTTNKEERDLGIDIIIKDEIFKITVAFDILLISFGSEFWQIYYFFCSLGDTTDIIPL